MPSLAAGVPTIESFEVLSDSVVWGESVEYGFSVIDADELTLSIVETGIRRDLDPTVTTFATPSSGAWTPASRFTARLVARSAAGTDTAEISLDSMRPIAELRLEDPILRAPGEPHRLHVRAWGDAFELTGPEGTIPLPCEPASTPADTCETVLELTPSSTASYAISSWAHGRFLREEVRAFAAPLHGRSCVDYRGSTITRSGPPERVGAFAVDRAVAHRGRLLLAIGRDAEGLQHLLLLTAEEDASVELKGSVPIPGTEVSRVEFSAAGPVRGRRVHVLGEQRRAGRWQTGLWVFDLIDPERPVLERSVEFGSSSRPGLSLTRVGRVFDGRAYVAALPARYSDADGAVLIYDLASPEVPTAEIVIPREPADEMQLEIDGSRLFVAGAKDLLGVYDLSRADGPRQIRLVERSPSIGFSGREVHGLFVAGDRVVVSNTECAVLLEIPPDGPTASTVLAYSSAERELVGLGIRDGMFYLGQRGSRDSGFRWIDVHDLAQPTPLRAFGVFPAVRHVESFLGFTQSGLMQVLATRSGDGSVLHAMPLHCESVVSLGDTEGADGPPPSRAEATMRLDVQPNPFNPRATFRFAARPGSHARLRVFDARGREVALLFDGIVSDTEMRTTWHVDEVASGVYFVRLEAEGRSLAQKVTLLE